MSDNREPYRVWSGTTTFRKNGTPVLGSLGSSAASVVVMTHATFTRLIAETPALAAALFEIGEV